MSLTSSLFIRLNHELYDNEVERSKSSTSSAAGFTFDRNLCKGGSGFPAPEVCPDCYGRRGRVRSKRTVLRYLYAVYTADKIL